MGNRHFSVYTSSRFSWRSSGTASTTEEFHPLETRTVEALRVFGPTASWIYLSLFLWGHPPMTDTNKCSRVLENLVQTQGVAVFPEGPVQELVDVLQIPKYYSNSSRSKQSLKTCIYHPAVKSISFLLKRRRCACLHSNWIHSIFIRHTASSEVPLAVLPPPSECPPLTLFLHANHSLYPTTRLSSRAVCSVQPGPLWRLWKTQSKSLRPLPAFEASPLSNLIFGGCFPCYVSFFWMPEGGISFLMSMEPIIKMQKNHFRLRRTHIISVTVLK